MSAGGNYKMRAVLGLVLVGHMGTALPSTAHASGLSWSKQEEARAESSSVVQGSFEDGRLDWLVGDASFHAMGQANASPLHALPQGLERASVANPGSAEQASEEESSFSGALFATLLALIGVVTVTRRGMSK